MSIMVFCIVVAGFVISLPILYFALVLIWRGIKAILPDLAIIGLGVLGALILFTPWSLV